MPITSALLALGDGIIIWDIGLTCGMMNGIRNVDCKLTGSKVRQMFAAEKQVVFWLLFLDGSGTLECTRDYWWRLARWCWVWFRSRWQQNDDSNQWNGRSLWKIGWHWTVWWKVEEEGWVICSRSDRYKASWHGTSWCIISSKVSTFTNLSP